VRIGGLRLIGLDSRGPDEVYGELQDARLSGVLRPDDAQLDASSTAAMAHPEWCPFANGASEPPHSGHAPYDFVGVKPLH
jgi:hypothetical protein